MMKDIITVGVGVVGFGIGVIYCAYFISNRIN